MFIENFDISKCNISSYNIFVHKNKLNNTTYNTTYDLQDIKYYCNTINLGNILENTKFIIDIDKFRNNLTVPIEYGVYSNFPDAKYCDFDNWPFMVIEFTIPENWSNCKVSYNKFENSIIYAYNGIFPNNFNKYFKFEGYFNSENINNYINILNGGGSNIYIIIKNEYERILNIDETFYISITDASEGEINIKDLPSPLGKRK
jgi:hypothetical protein